MNNDDILNLKYKICDNIEYTINQDGIVIVLEKKNKKIQNILRKLHFNIPKYKEVELDQYCSSVFIMLNGENNIKDIGEKLEFLYGDNVYPLYERLLTFINHINVDRNYIERIN